MPLEPDDFEPPLQATALTDLHKRLTDATCALAEDLDRLIGHMQTHSRDSETAADLERIVGVVEGAGRYAAMCVDRVRVHPDSPIGKPLQAAQLETPAHEDTREG